MLTPIHVTPVARVTTFIVTHVTLVKKLLGGISFQRYIHPKYFDIYITYDNVVSILRAQHTLQCFVVD